MGFWDFLRNRTLIGVMQPNVTYVGNAGEALDMLHNGITNSTVAGLWNTQPHLRTVVSFLARNIAQLGLHSFERVDETDRRRDRTSPLAKALSRVDGQMTTYELIYALVGDFLLYERAYWWVTPSEKVLGSAWMVRRLPPPWVTPVPSGPFSVDSYRVTLGDDFVDVPAANILPFTGYSPSSVITGSPTIEALRGTLQEQVEAAAYRAQVWKRGGRVSAVLQRPSTAPAWSDAAREAFREDWYAKYTGRGPKAGGTPILEDGMTLNRVDFNAQEQQFVEAAKLSLVTVAAAFHVNPTMIGQNDGANYSNVREFRKMLYGDTLGPLLAQIEQRINGFLLPMLGVDPERFYVEFNIAEKLQGNFEEQAAAMQTATGSPWMTRAEARARMNLPAIPGADELVVPLNVLLGGQASPTDSGSQNRASGPQRGVKARPSQTERTKAEQVLGAFFKRQSRAVLSALGSKADSWWDAERWDRELSADLLALSLTVTERSAKRAIEAAGGNPDDYDVDRTVRYLQAVAARTAASINETTKAQLDDALDDEEADPADVFEQAKGSRSVAAAVTLTTALSGFATAEAGKQSGAATKTWIVTSANARPSHAAMSGETVPISENFSNGMAWPGDSSDADEVAGCTCDVEFTYP